MNKIIEAMYKSEFPKLKIKIGVFKHKETQQHGFCVTEVNTTISDKTHMYIFDARGWELLKDVEVEGTERIMESFHQDLIEQMEKTK